jgi:MFS family permease
MSQTVPLPNRTNRKLAALNVIVVANAFIWYLLAFNTLKGLLETDSSWAGNTSILIFGINLAAIILSGLLGSFIVDKFKKRRIFLYLWLASGIAVSVIPQFLNVNNLTGIGLISAIFGVYFGLGMPATMGYFSSFLKIEGRGKMSGITFLLIASTFVIARFLIFDITTTCIVLASVRIMGLIVFHFMGDHEELPKETGKVKFISTIGNKSFLLYFIPWGMFTLINFLTVPIQSSIYQGGYSYDFLTAIENVVIAVVAVISGFIADRYGRKRLTIIGFVMLGIGYAAIGLSSASVQNITSADMLFPKIIFTITDGIAWGIFNVLFLFTLWGDLGQGRNSDKIYFLGALPYVSSYFMQLLFAQSLSEIQPVTVFSFASVFLFVAVLPLIYAPETLPEKNMKDRELKTYIEKAKQIAQKEETKKHKQQNDVSIKEHETPNKNSEEYEKAKALAEKYY